MGGGDGEAPHEGRKGDDGGVVVGVDGGALGKVLILGAEVAGDAPGPEGVVDWGLDDGMREALEVGVEQRADVRDGLHAQRGVGVEGQARACLGFVCVEFVPQVFEPRPVGEETKETGLVEAYVDGLKVFFYK